MNAGDPAVNSAAAVDRACGKAYWRLLPLLFLCYVVAYVDRSNVGIAKLTMQRDLPAFDNAVIGRGFGVFFLGYFLLEIPGSLLVERWSARKWLARIMISWGFVAALTAAVKTPVHFYSVRFLLGLAEAGFFPGVIVYLTHWFPSRSRARAMAIFLIGTPIAQLVSPRICNALLKYGTTQVVDGVAVHYPPLLGLHGWQWVYIGWGVPAVVLGVIVLLLLPDRPRHARWLTAEERDALETQLEHERANRPAAHRISVAQALAYPKVFLLAGVLFAVAAGNYALETFLPTLFQKWYGLNLNQVTWLLLLPPVLALVGQLVVGWSSDRTQERRLHTFVCVLLAGISLALVPFTRGHLPLTVLCFMAFAAGNKASQVPFWALPSLMLTGSAAAASTGLINSLGNLGGFLGPSALGMIEKQTGSFLPGLYLLAGMLLVASASLLLFNVTPGARSVQHGFDVLPRERAAAGERTES
jgi:ACS family tartrate transporter-like MFS transporter